MLSLLKFFILSFFLILSSIPAFAQNSLNLAYNSAPKCVHKGSGTDYPIGPNQKYKNISDIDWSKLQAGDSVRIYYRDEPYREKIIISTSGTKEQPIRICGVRGSKGERAIIDGENAINNPKDGEAYSNYQPMQGLAIIMLYNRDYEQKVSNIIIEGLHIRNAKKPLNFAATNGAKRQYENGAACIRVQAGDNIVIRDNEIENCANGIFTMSQAYNEASLTRNILIEGNYFHQNGQIDSYYEHSLYIQAIGAIYQFNRFGANATGSKGATLKERVAGSIIRYNWFDSGSTRILDMVEVEDAANWYIEEEYKKWADENNQKIDKERLEKVKRAEKAYRTTYVYGNFFKHIGSKTEASNLFHYGYDNDYKLARAGTLYFYNNTLLLLNDRNDAWRVRLFDIYPYDDKPAKEKIEAFNNIIYFANESENSPPSYFCAGRDSGFINFGVNWVSKSLIEGEGLIDCYAYEQRPVVNGLDNIIYDENNSPVLDFNSLAPIKNEKIRNFSQNLPNELQNYKPDLQYITHLRGKKRDSLRDLGAMALD